MIRKTNQLEFQTYLDDTSNLRGSADILYIPENITELKDILLECVDKNYKITLSAGRTGTTGGSVPQSGAIISLERFNQIDNFDTLTGTVKVAAGVTLSAIEKHVSAVGYCLRAVPTESLAYISGAVSTAASGLRGFRYGSIRNYVLALEIMLSDGRILDIQRGRIFAKDRHFKFDINGRQFEFDLPTYKMPVCKLQAGYYSADDMDIIDLFIGSEGTLGIILSVTLQLQKKALFAYDGLAFFGDDKNAFKFVSDVREARNNSVFNPTSLEFIDRNSLDFVSSEFNFIPSECLCAVYFEQESENVAEREKSFDIWSELLKANNALLDQTIIAETDSARAKLFEFRHQIPQNINEFLRQNKQIKSSADLAVPYDKLAVLYAFYKKNARRAGIHYVNFGHIGEAHLHFNFLPKTDKESISAKIYMRKFIQKAIELGGTVSAEHGIGKLKTEYLRMMYGDLAIEQMKAVKRVFDPSCELNCGNIF